MYKFVVLFALVAVAVAQTQYPAGVSPAQCPNYPYCSYNVPLPIVSNSLHLGYGQRYPDGVNPSTCPNYPFCGTGVEGPVGYRASGYPADVNPSTCPNYPYCF